MKQREYNKILDTLTLKIIRSEIASLRFNFHFEWPYKVNYSPIQVEDKNELV